MKPIFYFDDTCEFCRRCVAKWRNKTQGRVEFVPLDKTADEMITVIFISSDGMKYQGARAVLGMFENIQGRKWLLWMYLHLPLAGLFCEYLYKKVSSCRTCAEKIARILSP